MATLPYDADEALRHLRKQDATLAELIDLAGPLTLEVPTRFSPFEALTRSITYQQLHGKAAATILGRFRDSFPGRGFPSPEAVLEAPDAQLRGAGLSGAKMAAIRDLARKCLDGTVPAAGALRRMDDEAIIERITQVRGVGRWTVQMLLMFVLGRPDVLPVADFGVRKGFMLAYRKRRMVTPKALELHGERWRPFRSVASWYMWRAVERLG